MQSFASIMPGLPALQDSQPVLRLSTSLESVDSFLMTCSLDGASAVCARAGAGIDERVSRARD